MYWPVLEFFMYWGIRLLYRMLDQKTLLPKYKPGMKTHCKTIQAFDEIYSGPEFTLHYKYSYILVWVFVCFTFGAGLPMLFPLGFLALFLFYSIERLMIAYSYRKPPMFNSKANQRVLETMWWAPMLYCINGAWTFSNQQLFRNKVHMNEGHYVFVDTDHHLYQFFEQITPGSVFFIYLALMLLYSIYGCVDKRCFKKVDLRAQIFGGEEDA